MTEIRRLILGYIPNQACNLKCEYCYISQLDAWNKPTKMYYSPEHIAACLSVERLGGVSLINLTGNGETLLQPEVPRIIELLLKEGHFVEVVTNCTIEKRIREILNIDKELLKRLFFKASFHYKELKRLNLLEHFFHNIKLLRNAGISFTLELMAYDAIENDISEIIESCEENVGAVCQATIGRNQRKKATLLTHHRKDEYEKIWDTLESPMMKFKLDMLDIKRKEFCYAGAWSIFVNLSTGEAQPCYNQPYNQNIFKNPHKPILFAPVGYYCAQPFCINAHAHLTWGLIPELDTPTYEVMRNRKTKSGNEWLSDECRQFFSTRLYDTNEQYSKSRKLIYTVTHPFRLIHWMINDWNYNVYRIIKHVKRKIRWKKEK